MSAGLVVAVVVVVVVVVVVCVCSPRLPGLRVARCSLALDTTTEPPD